MHKLEEESEEEIETPATGSSASDEIEKYKSYQVRALIRKSLSIQSRQVCTNICQILTPLCCLTLIWLLKYVIVTYAEPVMATPTQLASFPRIMNPPLVPNWRLYDYLGIPMSSCEQWYLFDIADDDPELTEKIGESDWLPDYVPSDTQWGLLGNIPHDFCDSSMTYSPYFRRVGNDTTIDDELFTALEQLNEHRLHNNDAYISALADGSFTFKEWSDTKFKYKMQINDNRFGFYHRRNGLSETGYTFGGKTHSLMTITDGMLTMMDMMTQSLFKEIFDNTYVFTMLQYMPIYIDDIVELMRLLNILGSTLFPLSLSLLLPVFMYAIVLEKEEKLRELMKMNGMKMSTYWGITFLYNFFIYALMVGIFFWFGNYMCELQFFYQTNIWILLLFFIGWGYAQIALAFFFQAFLNKARTATVIGYLISIWMVLWGTVLNVIVYPQPMEMPWMYFLYPQFALTRGIYQMSVACGYYRCIETWDMLDDQTLQCIIFLYVGGTLFMFLGLYLNEVLPHEFGVQKHPLFCFKQCKKRQGVEEVYKDVQDQSKFTLRYKEHELEVNLGQEDTDVKNESRRIEAMEEPYANAALIVKGITKIYDMGKGKQPKIAVKHMNLVVERGEMFGLLGPNGAGKTTLISILTGLYQPDCGNAWVSGYDIVNSLDNVQLRMGVCPQFDILWPELTVYEHLLFYARVKGISSKYEHQKVREAMDEVHLGKFSHLKSTALSGGMKRRLSVAIALVGDPKIVFLDEPTTGLDPENRRQLWDILAKCKIGRAMVLTTHLMEEADVLCNRIGIQDHGVLRCVGNSQHLKNLYGGGYHLYINVHKQKYIERLEDVQFSIVEEAIQLVKAFVSDLLPHANLATDFNGSLIYLVPLEGTLVSDIFAAFEEKKDSLGIADWGISQSSLEDVFLNVIDETSNIG